MKSCNTSAQGLQVQPTAVPQTLILFRQAAALPVPELREKALALVRGVSLPVAVERGQQLAAALANPELARAAKIQVAAMVDDVFAFFGAFEDSESMRLDLCRMITEKYASLNVEEIALVFQRGKMGEFGKEGKPYGKLNGSHVLFWFTTYANSEEKLGYFERRNAAVRNIRDDDAQLVLPAGIALQKIDGSAFGLAPSAPVAPAEKAAITRADWHRMEAARLDAADAERAAERARKQALGRGMADALQIQAAAAAAWEEYARANFYALLTETQREVLKLSGAGVLSAEMQPIYSELSDWWQKLIQDWEGRDLMQK